MHGMCVNVRSIKVTGPATCTQLSKKQPVKLSASDTVASKDDISTQSPHSLAAAAACCRSASLSSASLHLLLECYLSHSDWHVSYINIQTYTWLTCCLVLAWYLEIDSSSSLLVNSSMEHCHTDDLMPNVPISCLSPSRVDPKVQGLKVIIDCPQPGSSRATYRPPPISRWSECDGNDTVMVLLGSGTSKVPKETQPEWLRSQEINV